MQRTSVVRKAAGQLHNVHAGCQTWDDEPDQLSIAASELAGKTNAKIFAIEDVPVLRTADWQKGEF